MSEVRTKGKSSMTMTDGEVCKELGITPNTLRSYLKHGPPGGGSDIRLVRRIRVGRQRRWNRASFYAFVSGDPTSEL